MFFLFEAVPLYSHPQFQVGKITYICTIRIKIYVNLANSMLSSLTGFFFEGQTKAKRRVYIDAIIMVKYTL